jgi:hypothetical protein
VGAGKSVKTGNFAFGHVDKFSIFATPLILKVFCEMVQAHMGLNR